MPYKDLNDLENKLLESIVEICQFHDPVPPEMTIDSPLIGPDSPLGLDSLDSVEIIAMIQSDYGVRIASKEKSIEVLNSLLNKFPNLIDGLYLLAKSFTNKAELTDSKENCQFALEIYDKVLKIEPNHVDTLAKSAYIKGRLGNLKVLKSEFKNLLKNFPDKQESIKAHLEYSLKKLDISMSLAEFIEEIG